MTHLHCFALNSNLILLIPLQRYVDNGKAKYFKFQSDSINTLQQQRSLHRQRSLNSNLILLIRDWTMLCGWLEISLNSNLILLIRFLRALERQRRTSLNSNLILLILPLFSLHRLQDFCFKFQSDSINTLVASSCSIADPSLNSNLILLIRSAAHRLSGLSADFKFQSDSINTILADLNLMKKYFPLNSNLILLIRGIVI